MLLDGVRIVSLCHYLQGPAAAQYLADMGANVIKVEPIGGAYERKWSGARVFVGDISGFYLCANRNKRSVSINLKSEKGREVFLSLVARADVVMENFRPGTLERLGLGPDVLRTARPDIILASATGYGPDGPYSDLPGQDLLIQARTGLISVTAGQQPGVLPAAAGCAVVDQHGGALFALGILGALFKRQRTGSPTRVESSLFNAGIDLQQEAITNYANGQMTRDVLRRDPHLATWFHEAPYGVYETADGRHVAISLNALDALEAALDEAVGAAPAGVSAAPLDPFIGRDLLAARLAQRIAELDLQTVVAALSARRLWHAPVTNYTELLTDPQARHNRVFERLRLNGADAVLVNHPNRYDGAVPGVRHVATTAGADTGAVLAEHGFDRAEIEALVESGVVA